MKRKGGEINLRKLLKTIEKNGDALLLNWV